MSRPTRVLAWKEWREQRPVIISGLAAVAVLPFLVTAGTAAMYGGVDAPSLIGALPLVVAMIVWPVFAAASGSTTFANELGDGTFGFLLSRPVSRARLWAVKVALGLCSVILIVAGSLILVRILEGLTGVESVPLAGRLSEFSSSGPLTLMTLAVSIFLLFACSVFFSTFMSRSLTAAGAGLVAAIVIWSAIVSVWTRLDLETHLEPGLLAAQLGFAGVFVLAASLWLFLRGGVIRGAGALVNVLLASSLAIGATGLVAIPLIHAQVRLSPSTAVLQDIEIGPGGEVVAVTVSREDGGSPRIWLARPDGSGVERLTDRLTRLPAISPDGSWLAYVSGRGPLGLRADGTSLHAVKLDGSGRKMLIRELPVSLYSGSLEDDPVFSPEGTRIAMTAGDRLLVASMDSAPVVELVLTGTPLPGAQVAGWTSDGKEVVLMSPASWSHETPTVVAAFEPASGELREIYRDSRAHGRLWREKVRSGFTKLPLRLKSEGSRPAQSILLDIRDGTWTEIEDGISHSSIDLSTDERWLAYATCASGEGGCKESQIHLTDLVSGASRQLAILPGAAIVLALSPAADSIYVCLGSGQEDPGFVSFIVATSGSVKKLEGGWWPVGWSGNRRVVLAGLWDSSRELAVADAATGELRRFYP